MLMTLGVTSVNPAETTNNNRQVKARSRASEHRSSQLQVSTDRTFTRQPKPQKRADYRRPIPTVNDSVQQQLQQQQQKHQQQYGAAMSHLDWTPIGQPKETFQKDYQQQQVRQPDAVITFVTPPPQPLPTTTTTHYKDEPSPKNHSQHLDDEIDEFRNLYRYVNASELSEGYNNKHRNVTHITNRYEAVDKYRKNSNFGFHDGVLENNKTRSQNSDSNNGVNGAKGQNKLSSQDVYNTDGESDEENNERPPQSNHLDFQLYPHRNVLHRIVNTDVLTLQLQANENNKHNDQVDGVNPVDQRTQIRYGNSQHLHLLDGESKSANILRDYPSSTTTAATYPTSIIDQENSHAELYDHNYIVYNTNDDVANKQRLNHNEGVDDVSNDFYRDDNPKYANANVEVDGRRNGTPHDYATVHTDSSKAQKHEDGRKFYVNNLKLDLQDAPKNKQRFSSNRHANMNVTTAAALEADSHLLTYKRPRGNNDERGEIEHRRRQKPSVNGGRAEPNPTILTTTSARPLRRKVQSSAQARRTAAEDDENDDGTGGRTLYGGQNGHERKHVSMFVIMCISSGWKRRIII